MYEIRIFDSNGAVNTFRKKVYVEESILSNKVPSENIITTVKELNDAVEKGKDIITKLEEAISNSNTNTSEEELKALKTSIDEINNKIKGKRVNILSFGAKGDESNDYEAFKMACEEAGPNGKVIFPETEKNKYFLDSEVKIRFKDLPILGFENQNTELRMNFAEDLKEAKIETPFVLVSKDKSQTININPIENNFNNKPSSLYRTPGNIYKNVNIEELQLIEIKGDDIIPVTGTITNDIIEFNSGLGSMLAVKTQEYGGTIEAVIRRKSDEIIDGNIVAYIHRGRDYYVCKINLDKMTYSIDQNINGFSGELVMETELPKACKLAGNKEVMLAVKGRVIGEIAFYLNEVEFYTDEVEYAEDIKLGLGYDYRYLDKASIGDFIEIEDIEYGINLIADKQKYIALGDNLTFGENQLDAYPELVGNLLEELNDTSIDIINYGKVGQTLGECIELVKEISDDIQKDDLVTINIGTQEAFNGMNADEYKAKLLELIDLLTTKTQNVFLTTLCIFDNDIDIVKYNSIIKKVGAIKSVVVIDLFNKVFDRRNLIPQKGLTSKQYSNIAKEIAKRLY